MTPALASGPVRVFFSKPISLGDRGTVAAARSILNADEVARSDRFRFDDDRNRFVAGRALVRRALSRLAGVEPADWRFTANEFGRPEIADPIEGRSLRFSASRTKGLVMCAVTEDREIGADLERITSHPTDVVDRFFSPDEAVLIRQSPEAERSSKFFAIWTLKEAYCKARGVGLSIPLPRISFNPLGTEPALSIDPPLEDDASDWRFRLLDPEPGYTAALCIDVRQQTSVEIEVDWIG